jgi:hypothetical protein
VYFLLKLIGNTVMIVGKILIGTRIMGMLVLIGLLLAADQVVGILIIQTICIPGQQPMFM